MSWLIHDAIIADNPELNDGTQESAEAVASMVEEALANPDSEYYQAAADNLVCAVHLWTRVRPDKCLPDIAGYYGRMVLPFGVTTQVTSTARQADPIEPRRQDGQDTEMDYVESQPTRPGSSAWPTTRSRSAWDGPAQQIRDINTGIKNGTLELDAIMIEGKTWTNEELLAIPQADRDALARVLAHVSSGAIGGKTGREILDGAYAAENEALPGSPRGR